MQPVALINTVLLNEVSTLAKDSARLRKNHNFHNNNDDAAHRLLNAIEPGSYVAPHRHCEASKDETIICVRGELAVVWFDEAGTPQGRAVLKASDATSPCGVNIPHGQFHTVFALASGTVFFEAKAGPYVAPQAHERATWAPQEGDINVPEYQQFLFAQLSSL